VLSSSGLLNVALSEVGISFETPVLPENPERRTRTRCAGMIHWHVAPAGRRCDVARTRQHHLCIDSEPCVERYDAEPCRPSRQGAPGRRELRGADGFPQTPMRCNDCQPDLVLFVVRSFVDRLARALPSSSRSLSPLARTRQSSPAQHRGRLTLVAAVDHQAVDLHVTALSNCANSRHARERSSLASSWRRLSTIIRSASTLPQLCASYIGGRRCVG